MLFVNISDLTSTLNNGPIYHIQKLSIRYQYFFVFINSDHSRVHLCIDLFLLQSAVWTISAKIGYLRFLKLKQFVDHKINSRQQTFF